MERKSSKSRLYKQHEIEEEEGETAAREEAFEEMDPGCEQGDPESEQTGKNGEMMICEDTVPQVVINQGSPLEEQAVSLDDVEMLSFKAEPGLVQSKTDDKHLSEKEAYSKMRPLLRSHALRDDTSPPPPDLESCAHLPLDKVLQKTEQTERDRGKLRNRLAKQSSSKSSQEDSKSPALSRDSSTETYTDSTGIDLEEFITMTLHKNANDRRMLLKLESDMVSLVKDTKRQSMKFSPMSSYHRMLVHRIAAFFGLEHNVDQTGTSVVVSKAKNSRIPDMKFRQLIRDDLSLDEPKKLLKRESGSFEDGKGIHSPGRQSSTESMRRNKSFEEREEEYEKARARIFNQQDSSSSQEGLIESPLSYLRSSRSRDSTRSSSRHTSNEDLRWMQEPRPWSSTDSDSSNRPMKPAVTKASSFGGISLLTRGDSSAAAVRNICITKAESIGCEKQAYTSTSTTLYMPRQPHHITPSHSTSPSPQPSNRQSVSPKYEHVPSPNQPPPPQPPDALTTSLGGGDERPHPHPLMVPPPGHYVWAVSSLESIPPGAILINPQTGKA